MSNFQILANDHFLLFFFFEFDAIIFVFCCIIYTCFNYDKERMIIEPEAHATDCTKLSLHSTIIKTIKCLSKQYLKLLLHELVLFRVFFSILFFYFYSCWNRIISILYTRNTRSDINSWIDIGIIFE
jgi:Ca2+/Na+ antiporter